MARLDLAERCVTLADANRDSAKLVNLFRNRALETLTHVGRAVLNPGWSDTDKMALESRLARLRSLLGELEFGDLGAEIQGCPANGDCPEPAAAKTSDSPNEHSSDPLTRREREVIQCVAEGHGTKQVAEILGIKFKTAACHRYRAMEKLGIHDTAMLVRYAIRAGLVQP